MVRRLRVAVVGLGIGRSHLKAYAELPDRFEVKAVCGGAALAGFEPAPESFEGEFTLIHYAITGNAPAPVSLHDARQSLELITAIYHSAETGTAVTLPIAREHPKYKSWIPASGRFARGAGLG